MQKLWFISWAMVAVGFGMALGGIVAGLGPVVLVCGVLLAWSGLVKGIVLRIWRSTLISPPLHELMRPGPSQAPSSGRQS